MLDRIAEQQTSILAVLAESKATDRDKILTSGELAIIDIVGVLTPLAQPTEVLGAEMVPTLSVVQPLLTALKRKHLKVSDVDSKVTVDMKTAIATSIDSRFLTKISETSRCSCHASILDTAS